MDRDGYLSQLVARYNYCVMRHPILTKSVTRYAKSEFATGSIYLPAVYRFILRQRSWLLLAGISSSSLCFCNWWIDFAMCVLYVIQLNCIRTGEQLKFPWPHTSGKEGARGGGGRGGKWGFGSYLRHFIQLRHLESYLQDFSSGTPNWCLEVLWNWNPGSLQEKTRRVF